MPPGMQKNALLKVLTSCDEIFLHRNSQYRDIHNIWFRIYPPVRKRWGPHPEGKIKDYFFIASFNWLYSSRLISPFASRVLRIDIAAPASAWTGFFGLMLRLKLRKNADNEETQSLPRSSLITWSCHSASSAVTRAVIIATTITSVRDCRR